MTTTAVQPVTPHVGDGATITMWGERTPATVVAVQSADRVVVREDEARWAPDGRLVSSKPSRTNLQHVVTRRRDGRWLEQGDTYENDKDATTITFGSRDGYRDPKWS